jgi:hypothetical protein
MPLLRFTVIAAVLSLQMCGKEEKKEEAPKTVAVVKPAVVDAGAPVEVDAGAAVVDAGVEAVVDAGAPHVVDAGTPAKAGKKGKKTK